MQRFSGRNCIVSCVESGYVTGQLNFFFLFTPEKEVVFFSGKKKKTRGKKERQEKREESEKSRVDRRGCSKTCSGRAVDCSKNQTYASTMHGVDIPTSCTYIV